MANMPELADFHIHSKYSFDGILSPAQIEQLAIRNNLKWIAITDHNTLQSSIDLWKEQGESLKSPYITLDSGVNAVSGVEVTCRVMSVANLKGNTCKVHLLVYAPDMSQDSPIVRLMEIKHQNDLDYDLRKLNYLISLKPGCCITLEEIQEWCRKNNVEGEPSNKQLMDFLDDKGIDLGVYTERKLSNLLDKMPPVQRLDLDAEKLIKVAHASGGFVIMAHPSLNLRRTANKMDLLESLLKAGLDGFELLYTDANPETSDLIEKAIRRFAKNRYIIYSGGSDTHNLLEGNTLGKWHKNKNITLESQERGVVRKVESLQNAFEKGVKRRKIDLAVEKYITECAQKAAGIKASKGSSRKPKKPKNKKHYKEKLTALEYYYTAEDELEK